MNKQEKKELLPSIKKVTVQQYDPLEDTMVDVEVYNTTKHQLAALDVFARDVGFIRTSRRNSYVSILDNLGRVSFNKMVWWYNTGFRCGARHSYRGLEKELPIRSEYLGISLDKMVNALNEKLFQRVYLQCKRDGSIITQKHILKFC